MRVLKAATFKTPDVGLLAPYDPKLGSTVCHAVDVGFFGRRIFASLHVGMGSV